MKRGDLLRVLMSKDKPFLTVEEVAKRFGAGSEDREAQMQAL